MSNSLTPQAIPALQGAPTIAPRHRDTITRSFAPRQLALGGHTTVKDAITSGALRIASFLAILLAVNLVCGIERLQFHLNAHHPTLVSTWIGEGVRTLHTLFSTISFAFETFVLWFSTDLMDLGMQGLFDWRHGMMCFLFTVLISVAFFAMGSVIVDRMTKHGDVR